MMLIFSSLKSFKPHKNSKIEMIQTLRDEEEEEEDQQSDWRFCAMVVDRLSLFLFTFLIFSFSAVVFFATPNILDAQPVIE